MNIIAFELESLSQSIKKVVADDVFNGGVFTDTPSYVTLVTIFADIQSKVAQNGSMPTPTASVQSAPRTKKA